MAGIRSLVVGGWLLSAAWIAAAAHAAIPDSERQALIDFYNSTGGPQWMGYGWNGPAGTECTWEGITCDSDGTHVIALALGDLDEFGGEARLQGSLPASLNQLTELTLLDVTYNELSGPLPDLSSLTALTAIYLGLNGFSGSLPSIASMPNLQVFVADRNFFSGSIPDLSHSAQLTTFTVSGNFLSGPLPSLSGATALQTFDVHYNQLSGSPPAIAGLHALNSIDLSDNTLTGNLPAFEDVPSLSSFEASDNLLTGSIPALSGASNLAVFGVSGNLLSGTLPSLTGLPLTGFAASDNDLSGPLPSLAGQTALVEFDVEYNRLSGTVPSLADLPALQMLRIAYNQFEGDAPADPPNLSTQYVSSLCPNAFAPRPDAGWDAATQSTPWYASCAAPPPNLNQFGLTGSWYDPQAAGTGFLLDSMPNSDGSSTLFGGRFSTDLLNDDANNQRWFALQGDVGTGATSALLAVYATDTGTFAAPSATSTYLIGRARATFTDCTHGLVTTSRMVGFAFDGEYPITRLTENTNCGQDGDNGHVPSNALLSGAWFDPAVPGQGFLIDISAEQRTLFVAWYTYAIAGAHPTAPYRWYTMQLEDVPPGEINVNRVPIYVTPGGELTHFGYQAVTERVGSAQLEFDGCNALTLGYSFTSGENALLNGVLHLQRLGPAPPQCPY